MTSHIISRFCGLGKHASKFAPHQHSFFTPSNRQTTLQILYNQTRQAGHAKWQNIAGTKKATDMAKGKMISRYVLLVRRAVVSNNMQPDPKLNGKLADVLSEAGKMNVPKATLERAIARAINIRIIPVNLEIQGPGGSALIARCETDNVAVLRREIKKILRKFDSNLMMDDTLINMFHSKGFVRAATKTTDNRDIDEDFAEEAAILANAEEVSLEVNEDATDPALSKVWVFNTDATRLNPCKGELEKLGLKILSHDLDLVPYRNIDFGADVYEKVSELIEALSEHEHVIAIFHNVEPPKEAQ